jgi:nucleotide-binding universal stress UspA family protein
MISTTGEDQVRPVLICYDGSRASVEALEYTASVLPSARAIVVTVWRDIPDEAASSGTRPPAGDLVEATRHGRRAATEAAREGAERAKKAGIEAEPLVVDAAGPMWKAIDSVAHEHDALLIACGTNRSGIKAVLPGDLAEALVEHASRAVLAVPTRKAVAERGGSSRRTRGR